MKRWKVYGCAAVFLLLTAVKMIAPAAASDARAVLVPAIGADDDYRAVFAEIRSAFSTARVGEQDVRLQPYLPDVDMSAWATPAPEPTPTPTPQPTPEPTPELTPEPTQSPELQAAFAAREAFLDAQAVYSGYAVPANVSYAVSELPFAHGSPVAGYTSSGFGYRLHPLENKVKFHYGQTSRPIPARRSVPLLTARCSPPGRARDTATMSSSVMRAAMQRSTVTAASCSCAPVRR